MSAQLPLDFRRLARRNDPSTSKVAAARVIDFADGHYALIIAALAHGEATIYEIAERSGLSHVQVARRMPELAEAALVVDTGSTKPSPSGRPCRIWRLAEVHEGRKP